MAGFTGHAALAGVHGGYQLDAGGIGDAVIGPRNGAFAGFQRLAERIEHDWGKFRKFIQKQHAVVRHGHLARPCANTATDHGCHRG